ncbi:hypothetical protein [Alloactinosynnema sp. L-07]|nr:hypothetical protein [Alloactinosynnema sp. L-07]
MPSAVARRRGWLLTAAMVAVAAALSVAGGLADFGEDEPGVALPFGSALVLAFALFVSFGDKVWVRGDSHLSAKTVTGWRTIDLHAVKRVWRLRLPTEGQARIDRLVITDRHRVRVMVDHPDADQAVRDALRHSPIALSKGARRRLDDEELPLLVRFVGYVAKLVGMAAGLLFLWFVAYAGAEIVSRM